MPKKINSLSLLANYNSDSDNDSGYRSEDEKKRKQEFLNSENTKKKQKITEMNRKFALSHECTSTSKDEDMCIDVPYSSYSMCNSDPSISTHDRNNTATSVSNAKTLGLIPLPDDLLLKNDCIDDPVQHDGRIRSFAHERGNWASLICIPLFLGSFNTQMNSLISSLISACKEHNVDLRKSDDIHISISKTFVIRIDWIQPLVEEMKRKICKIKRFSTWLHQLKIYTNEEKSRTFLALNVGHGKQKMDEITSVVCSILQKYNLNVAYKDASFHASIAWCLGNKTTELNDILSALESICHEYFEIDNEMRTFSVNEISFKTGNRIHNLKLSD